MYMIQLLVKASINQIFLNYIIYQIIGNYSSKNMIHFMLKVGVFEQNPIEFLNSSRDLELQNQWIYDDGQEQ